MRREPLALPPKQARARRRAVRLEWLTLAYLVSTAGLMMVTMGQSQAMKTAWIDDTLSLVPPAVFLIAERMLLRPADRRYPYGFHRATSIAFLLASFALLAMGFFLLYDAVRMLFLAERPSIGTMSLLGERVWAGWPMIVAALYSAIPAMLLGRRKTRPGRILHDKVLYADARMNQADWLTGMSAALGVLGIGAGWWWADGVAALVISLAIARDGLRQTRRVFSDLLDHVPVAVDTGREEPIVARVRRYLSAQRWIVEHEVRIHEEGHYFFGEALIVPDGDEGLTERIQRVIRDVSLMDWRMRDFTVTPVRDIGKVRRIMALSEERPPMRRSGS